MHQAHPFGVHFFVPPTKMARRNSVKESLTYSDWPIRTDSLCHHCCHGFDSIPVPLPQTYDRLRQVYHCEGVFCSWQCAKAHNLANLSTIGRGDRNTYISLLAYKMWVKHKLEKDGKVSGRDHCILDRYSKYHIVAAPRKECLKAFGGDVDIVDYRRDFFGIVPPSPELVGETCPNLKASISREANTLPFVNLSVSRKPTDGRVSKVVSAKPINAHKTPFMVPSGSPKATTLHKSANEFCKRLNRAKEDKSDSSTMLKRKRARETRNTLMASMGIVVEKINK